MHLSEVRRRLDSSQKKRAKAALSPRSHLSAALRITRGPNGENTARTDSPVAVYCSAAQKTQSRARWARVLHSEGGKQ